MKEGSALPALYLRLSTNKDLNKIVKIINNGKTFLKSQNINQWQDGYPAAEDISNDIKNSIGYVFIEDGEIAGYAALHQGIDPMYLKISNGNWITGTHARYTAIHRIAMASKFRGQHLAEKMISNLITVSGVLGYKDLRIDTHPDNKIMQHTILKSGFEKRGTVHMPAPDGSPRFAYELQIV